jgi:acyl-coenzyme A thioesterase 13
LIMMSDNEADRKKAMAAVRAMFQKYKLIAAQRPKDHIVSNILLDSFETS